MTFSTSPLVKALDCPEGWTSLDCAAVYNSWPSWVPNSCGDNLQNTALDGYDLPADIGGIGVEAPIDANGKVSDPANPDFGKSVAFARFANLGVEYRNFYIKMRWTYASWNWDGSNTLVNQKEYDWMGNNPTVVRPKLVVVSNPRTGRSIIAAALDSGPAPWTGIDTQPDNTPKQGWTNPQVGTPPGYTGRVAGLPQTAIDALQAQVDVNGKGDQLVFSWAPDQNVSPGIPETPIPQASAADQSDLCFNGTASLNGVAFISQRDKRWDNTTLCMGAGHDRVCFSTHDEGCWAASAAMIISTFKGSLVTPMQTEGSGEPHESFDSEHLNDTGYLAMTNNNIDRAVRATQAGALVMIHGAYGVPWYNTSTHYEVIRGVTATGKFIVNDPWDLPDPANDGVPNKTAGWVNYDGRNQYNSARSYGEWSRSDLLQHGLDLRIISRKGQNF